MSLYLGNNLVSGVATPTEPTRNLGQIIESLVPLTDAGLHLLDGALIDGSGIYSAFVTHIAAVSVTNPERFCTEQEWQQSVTDYGVCGKFVYDSVNNTVRLPKLGNQIYTTGQNQNSFNVDVYGNGNCLNLINGNGSSYNLVMDKADNHYLSIAQGGVHGVSPVSPGNTYQNPEGHYGVNTNKTMSGLTGSVDLTDLSHSETVYYYIVIATTTKTEIEVDIDEIATDLNGKVNIADCQEVQCVVETYQNGTSWYRVYSDGWCEQGGYSATGSGTVTINFLKAFADTNYIILKTMNTTSTNAAQYCNVSFYSRTTTSAQTNTAGVGYSWYAAGYIEV